MAHQHQRSQQPCRFFEQTGRCRFGAKCRYSHRNGNDLKIFDGLSRVTRKDRSTDDPGRIVTPDEARFREWRFHIPKDRNIVTPLPGGLPKFFQTAWTLVEDGRAEIQQQVIEKLACEGGLQRINEAVLEVNSKLTEQQRLQRVEDTFLPLFRVVSYPDVTTSWIMESRLATLHNFIYGVNGRRAVTIFSSAAAFLKSLKAEPAAKSVAIIATLSCLYQTMELNSAAKVSEELVSIINEFTDLSMDDLLEATEAKRLLNRIRLRAGLGAIMPIANEDQPSAGATTIPTFNLARDLPGALSASGPRHDNDHENIVDIQILPTASEIHSDRPEYLPVKDPRNLHLGGLEGLVDRLFRLLREDTVGQLRDAVRLELQRLQDRKAPIRKSDRSSQGVQTFSYRDIQLERISFDRLGGLRAQVSFRQPTALSNKDENFRQQWWRRSKRLSTDALLCLLDSSGSATFFCVCDELSEQEKRTAAARPKTFYMDPKRASVALRLVEPHQLDIKSLSDCFLASANLLKVLCEFPGVLLPSFHATLKALQQMSRTLDMPFSDQITASSTMLAIEVTQPPIYAAKPGFKFDLDSLTKGEHLELSMEKRFDYTFLRENSSLDSAQQTAVIDALSRKLALIQGPPGTGKSYTGVALIKALLANAGKANLGPIICVCYTNHALDQLLEHLVKDGVDQVIRIGSRSKSELLKNLNLREVSQNIENTSVERRIFAISRGEIESEAERIKMKLQNLAEPERIGSIKYYLYGEHKRHHDQLFTEEKDEDGFQKVDYDKRNALTKWLVPRNSFRFTSDNIETARRGLRTIQQLQNVNLWEMLVEERVVLHQYWVDQIRQQSFSGLQAAFSVIKDHLRTLDECRQEQNLRCLTQSKVIGVTTTGLARNLELLRHVRSKVLLCEEAGEVLEAHLVTAFLPSLEHAILIGDHQQLRPQIQNYGLSSENPRGVPYSLDVSLFERLIQPTVTNSQALPFSTLEVQRRMHPSIAQLIRKTLYPRLRDHESVCRYPPVEGVKPRLYWVNHDVPENKAEAEESTSQSNDHEVEMVAALVTHLVRQNRYTSEDIAVLTPYQGQFDKIRRRLLQSFEIVIGDRDEEEMERREAETENVQPLGPFVQKTNLSKAIRLATVDNFQGEEAKIIIVSLVRSNEQRKCGFLKTSNRINVLLSRAEHGLYIFGNSETYRHVHMWDEVINMIEEGGNLGSSLALHCPRHPETVIEVSSPDDFAVKAPEGGCDLMCEWRLTCGHKCITKCHNEARHQTTTCLEPCPRSLPGCDHKCPLLCGQACAKCKVEVLNVKLPCGHIEESLACYLSQDTSLALCCKEVPQIVTECGHTVSLRCHEGRPGPDFVCKTRCGAILPCGHPCQMQCHQCNLKKGGKITKTEHGICIKKCGRNFNTCNHKCTTTCHGDRPCDLCCSPCEVACQHSRCAKKCSEPCAPCAELCTWQCPHQGRCPLPCAVPCSLLPCSQRCDKKLDCGHQCPSICGEICPPRSFCQSCCSEELRQMDVDYILGTTFGETDLDEDPCIVPQCGHVMTTSSMDGHLSITDFYDVDEKGTIIRLKSTSQPFSSDDLKDCPKCRSPIRNVNRYNRILRRGLIDEATKKFISWSNTEFTKHAGDLQMVQDKLFGTQESEGKSDWRQGNHLSEGSDSLKLHGNRNEIIKTIRNVNDLRSRYRLISSLRNSINKFCLDVKAGEHPFRRIWDLLQDRRRQQGQIDSDLTLEAHVSQPRAHLLALSLSLRCDLTILSDALALRKKKSGLSSRYGWAAVELEVDFSQLREECMRFLSHAVAQKQHRLEVEARLFFAQYAALERTCFKDPATSVNKSTDLRESGLAQLALAVQTCKDHPDQVRGIEAEIDAVQKMLQDGTFYTVVTTREMRDVYTAMSRDFRGTGHWYNCENGHPFTVGECGMPMEQARCPQCGSPVGGRNHRPEDGVTRNTEIEAAMANLTL